MKSEMSKGKETVPEKPNSSLQKYRLAQKERDLIAKLAKETGADGK